jgi:hypothetical protein
VSTAPQYEFTEEQNKHFAGLASKMRFVGLFSVLFGVFALLLTLFVIAFVFRDRLPSGYREKAKEYMEKAKEKLPEDMKKQADDFSVEKVPTDNSFLWGVAIFSGVTGLIFLLQGVWSRSSGASFQKIVDTKGNDVTNLMNAVGSLQSMYGMISTLLGLALIAGLVAVGLTVYHYFGSR